MEGNKEGEWEGGDHLNMDETQCSGDEGKQSLGIVRVAGKGRYDIFVILVDVFH